MIDFASALYLGMRHPSRSLRPWQTLTTGTPAALGTPEVHRRVARELARLQGCRRAVLAHSTLHLIWDLFGMWSRSETVLLVDAGVYPITRWGRRSLTGKRVLDVSFLSMRFALTVP